MTVCHIRRIHIVSSTIRIYLSIIKYPILQMKKFQTNNRIPQMSIMKNTPIVLTRYVSCTFICQISYNNDESSVDESLLEVASAISISFHASGKSTKWGRYSDQYYALYCALSICSSLRGPVQYQASLCARMEQSRAAAVQIIRTVSRGHTDINCNKFA